jgi:hypothetical protein
MVNYHTAIRSYEYVIGLSYHHHTKLLDTLKYDILSYRNEASKV